MEYAHVPQGKEVLRRYMEDKGYSVYRDVTEHVWADDFIFVSNKYKRPQQTKPAQLKKDMKKQKRVIISNEETTTPKIES